MIAQRTIILNNIKKLELDQLAVRALYDPNMRRALLDRISPLDRPVTNVMGSIDHYLGPRGCETRYTYVPEGVMIRRLYGGLGNIVGKGILEYERVHRDRRGHFFDLYLDYGLPKNEDDAVLCVSHFTANRWAAERRLKIVEDVEAVDMPYVDTAMRVYSHNRYDNDVVPDIPITDIDMIAVTARSQDELEGLAATAPSYLKEAVMSRLFPVPALPSQNGINILSCAGSALSAMGCAAMRQGNLVKDPSIVFFWEMQKISVFPDDEDMGAFAKSIKAIRDVLAADPQLWGKTGEGYFDPLGIINYMIRSGKLSVSE